MHSTLKPCDAKTTTLTPHEISYQKCLDSLWGVADILRNIGNQGQSGKDLLNRLTALQNIEPEVNTIPLYLATHAVMAATRGLLMELNPELLIEKRELDALNPETAEWAAIREENLEFFRQLAKSEPEISEKCRS